jgi:hypothetical protein
MRSIFWNHIEGLSGQRMHTLINAGTNCSFVREMQQNCYNGMLLPENNCVDYLKTKK